MQYDTIVFGSNEQKTVEGFKARLVCKFPLKHRL
jgi:hypothetical protein